MFNVGPQEMIVIFLVALVVFGPKKLPELGKTIGKALTEFRRASSDLKATFEREMTNLERESESLKQVADSTANTIHQHVNYDPFADQEGAISTPAHTDYHSGETPTAHEPTTVSASEVPSAESHGTVSATAVAPPETAQVEGTVARSDSGTHQS